MSTAVWYWWLDEYVNVNDPEAIDVHVCVCVPKHVPKVSLSFFPLAVYRKSDTVFVGVRGG